MQHDLLRSKYLEFFKKNGHSIVPSSSLVPENDPTTLFTGSGMQPMIEYLLGAKHPKGTRIADSQKCFRSQDIEEVGDNRHTTFFEMLGNWSLGDYFKEEQLTWFFMFITKEVALDPNKIFVTVFRGNDQLKIGKDFESVEIWKKLFKTVGIEARDIDFAERDGMQGGKIFYYDQQKNWWSRSGVPANMPEGEPGGPDSEVFYDLGEEKQLHQNSQFKDKPCHVNCDCGRFLEIGNSVFMQYQKQKDGSFKELAQKNVDFGGGFERILVASQNTDDIFSTSIFESIIKFIEKISGKKYSQSSNKHAFRVIADHMRAATMLANDGVYPSSKEQGYFSRRLVRRAIRYAKMLDINQPFVSEITKVVAQLYLEAYPEVNKNIEKISEILALEEKKFASTLQKGLKEVEKVTQLTGEVAFKLYETYGFPFELSQEIAKEKGQLLSQSEFDMAKSAHADKSRLASAGKFKGGLQDSSEQTTKYHTATHLLHAALRKILGKHVAQKGSNITAERLRFDFAHVAALTDEEIKKVQDQVNEWIAMNLPVRVEKMAKQKALDSGAVAFFVEKYPDEVTVYTVGNDAELDWVSKELCGGPHVKNTGEIGKISIFKEKAVSAGVRRLYLK